MEPRPFLIVCFAGLAAAALAAVAVGAWQIYDNLPDHGIDIANVVFVYGGGIAFLLVAVIALFWAYLDHAIAQPLSAVVRGIQTVIHSNPDHRIEIDDVHHLGGLPQAVDEVVRQLATAKLHVSEAINAATTNIERQKNQLAIIIRDLQEGVVVCTMQHRISLYNHRALQLLHITGEVGLDRSLFDFLTRPPLDHAIERLKTRLAEGRYRPQADDGKASFVGSTIDGRFMLEGRASLILDQDGAASGYVLLFEDDTEKLAALGVRDRLLRDSIEGLRAPIANLRAAIEILCGSVDLDPRETDAFKQVLLKESKELSDRLEDMAARHREIITGHWPMSDLYSSNLFLTLARRLQEHRDIRVMMVGLPQWLHGDSYTLLELLDRLIQKIGARVSVSAVDVEAVAGERRVYIDIIWHGTPVPATELHAWLDERIEEALGGLSLRDVLDRHKTDVWCLADRHGRARLRLPLPAATRAEAPPDTTLRPPRPEFYDFDLLRRSLDLGDLGTCSLRAINYVVFDCETTGLEPSAGDEIVAIAGVRIVNGRILTGESFERLVDPRRSIPPTSIRFHGITEDLVRDKPPIQVVLPQFYAFVGDAVLVAHNAAFDLKFLQMKESESAVKFSMPVLDTLLLSAFLHDYTTHHSLDACAQRFGIPVQGRHTALGDAFVTAGVFLKMIDLLAARGIYTLDEAIAATQKIVEVRLRQAAF